ncbi:hypothetical protein SAMN02745166_03615 [Prosthecobacter debontii]|uniref:Uncharacterized protein n=1 Tax=Prosthecobacter debontii TaxID=48467 RepID=A0A1T4YKS8_9BACT|nr:hypothetical protein SAMN02745166_03615 [Prosthecobacter debontii]
MRNLGESLAEMSNELIRLFDFWLVGSELNWIHPLLTLGGKGDCFCLCF